MLDQEAGTLRAASARGEPDEEEDALAHAVIGAAIEVHRHLGPGYLESVYEDALAIELTLRRIPFERQMPIAVNFKGHPVGEGRWSAQCLFKLFGGEQHASVAAALAKANLAAYEQIDDLPSLECSTFGLDLPYCVAQPV